MTPTSPNPTWYDVLGVSRDASPAEIKAAWRNATDKFEPGSGSGQFRMFNEAADVLLDPDRRAAYDASLDAETQVQPEGQPVARGPATAAARRAAGRRADDETTDQPGDPHGPQGRATPGACRAPSPEVGGTLRLPPTSRRPAEPGSWLAVLALLTVAALVAAGFFALQVREDAQTAAARDDAPGAAESAAKAILSYDYRRLPTDRKRAKEFLTPKYQKEYDKTFKKLEVQKDGSPGAAVQTKTSVTADVVGSGVMDADPDTARVLVFVNQVSKRPGRDPQMFQNRVAMTMKLDEDRWLVDHLDSY